MFFFFVLLLSNFVLKQTSVRNAGKMVSGYRRCSIDIIQSNWKPLPLKSVKTFKSTRYDHQEIVQASQSRFASYKDRLLYYINLMIKYNIASAAPSSGAWPDQINKRSISSACHEDMRLWLSLYIYLLLYFLCYFCKSIVSIETWLCLSIRSDWVYKWYFSSLFLCILLFYGVGFASL